MKRFTQVRFWLSVALGVVLSVTITQTARAAAFTGADVYRLPAGRMISDDLYIAASEIYIDRAGGASRPAAQALAPPALAPTP
ncbi:hypothetical protein EKD04_025000 [Chloroflexales bacterium ZM16-3]|nr:hypothetical protein [Chloroflexales bacterium ZM16-3]